MMTVAELRRWCAERGACSGAVAWLETRTGTAAEAWADVEQAMG